jgi:hypothetical protein
MMIIKNNYVVGGITYRPYLRCEIFFQILTWGLRAEFSGASSKGMLIEVYLIYSLSGFVLNPLYPWHKFILLN